MRDSQSHWVETNKNKSEIYWKTNKTPQPTQEAILQKGHLELWKTESIFNNTSISFSVVNNL